jgi:hypothetical protein
MIDSSTKDLAHTLSSDAQRPKRRAPDAPLSRSRSPETLTDKPGTADAALATSVRASPDVTQQPGARRMTSEDVTRQHQQALPSPTARRPQAGDARTAVTTNSPTASVNSNSGSARVATTDDSACVCACVCMIVLSLTYQCFATHTASGVRGALGIGVLALGSVDSERRADTDDCLVCDGCGVCMCECALVSLLCLQRVVRCECARVSNTRVSLCAYYSSSPTFAAMK